MTAVLTGTQAHENQIAEAIRASLTPDLLSRRYQSNPRAHCYVASEAFFHATGGYAGKWRPKRQPLEGGQHWWLEDGNGGIVDLTADQFPFPIDHTVGRGCGFLTRQPSRRARIVLDIISQAQDGLSAGEVTDVASVPAAEGGDVSALATPRQERSAPAERSFSPDWKKGKK